MTTVAKARNDAPSEKTRIKRGANRAEYDRETIHSILDNNLICQVGFVVNGGARVIPTAHLRIDETLYLHGNRRNLMLNSLLDGQTACVSVTQLDGLVLARSGFHHSVNYKSVVAYGLPELVEDEDEAIRILDAFVNKMAPGRMTTLRDHSEKELNATIVVAVPILEASAKVRTGPPVDDDEDYTLDIWAGVVPMKVIAGTPEADPKLKSGVALPDHLRQI